MYLYNTFMWCSPCQKLEKRFHQQIIMYLTWNFKQKSIKDGKTVQCIWNFDMVLEAVNFDRKVMQKLCGWDNCICSEIGNASAPVNTNKRIVLSFSLWSVSRWRVMTSLTFSVMVAVIMICFPKNKLCTDTERTSNWHNYENCEIYTYCKSEEFREGNFSLVITYKYATERFDRELRKKLECLARTKEEGR